MFIALHLAIPILGLILLGLKYQNDRRDRQIKALVYLASSKSRR